MDGWEDGLDIFGKDGKDGWEDSRMYSIGVIWCIGVIFRIESLRKNPTTGVTQLFHDEQSYNSFSSAKLRGMIK